MKNIWIVDYNSGYTSESFVEVYSSEDKARARWLELIEGYYQNDDRSLILEHLYNGEDYIDDDTELLDGSLSWDGVEVYEELSYYQTEIL